MLEQTSVVWFDLGTAVVAALVIFVIAFLLGCWFGSRR